MIAEWIRIHETLLGYMGALSLITFVLTLMLVPILVTRIPADYFLYDKKDLKAFRRQHPLGRIFTIVVKNFIGFVFICAGLAMLVLPGQGIITILIGMTLISFPKKRALECRIIKQRTVVRTINWMRSKAGKPPLKLPRSEGRGVVCQDAACPYKACTSPENKEPVRKR